MSRLLTLHRTVGQLAHDNAPRKLDLPEARRADRKASHRASLAALIACRKSVFRKLGTTAGSKCHAGITIRWFDAKRLVSHSGPAVGHRNSLSPVPQRGRFFCTLYA